MMNRIYAFLIAAILLSGCAESSFTPTPTLLATAETPNPLPEPSDPTQLLTVNAGETFDIVLPSNPSTGYRWDFATPLDESLIQFVSQDYIAQEPVLPGSGGVDVWTFRAISAGDTTIELGYYPPSNDTEPDETVVFSVRVE
jgi:inhibitor of cysteine peptidase